MENNAVGNGGGSGPYSNHHSANNSGTKNSNHHLWQQMNQMPKFSVNHVN